MPETSEKNTELQLLIDALSVKDNTKQAYYFTVKVGKYYSPESERTIVSHIDNKNATGVTVLMEYIEKAKSYDFDFIEIELYTKYKNHEIDAQKPFERKRINVSQPPKPQVVVKENEQLLGMVEEKLQIRETIMRKDFEIAQLRIENIKLKKQIEKTVIRLGEIKDKLILLKTNYLKLKKILSRTKEKSEKEIENLKEDVKIKKLLSSGLGTALTKIKIKGHDLGSLLGTMIDTDDFPANQEQSQNQNFNIRNENDASELDKLKKEMLQQVEIYLKNQDEKTCMDFYNILVYVVNSKDNMQTILELIK